jgi:hypothetical protein
LSATPATARSVGFLKKHRQEPPVTVFLRHRHCLRTKVDLRRAIDALVLERSRGGPLFTFITKGDFRHDD